MRPIVLIMKRREKRLDYVCGCYKTPAAACMRSVAWDEFKLIIEVLDPRWTQMERQLLWRSECDGSCKKRSITHTQFVIYGDGLLKGVRRTCLGECHLRGKPCKRRWPISASMQQHEHVLWRVAVNTGHQRILQAWRQIMRAQLQGRRTLGGHRHRRRGPRYPSRTVARADQRQAGVRSHTYDVAIHAL